jgi:chemotaxis-related protein WspD
MSTLLPVLAVEAPADDCWNHIGVTGDRSCPKLVAAIHCRNCEVFAAAGRRLLDRQPPEGYLADWTQRLASPEDHARKKDHSAVVFRLGSEWLALDTRFFVETTEPRVLRRIPHARSAVLRGLVNIRGRLELCVSLEAVLHTGARASTPGAIERMLVVEHERRGWVFAADEVHGVHHFSARDLAPVPATVQRSPGSHARALLAWKERTVGYIDAEKLFRTLDASIA